TNSLTIVVTTTETGKTTAVRTFTVTVTGAAATIVNIPAIPGVTPPATGATPVTTITQTAQYTGTVSWSPAHNPFLAGQVYIATITLTAKPGYTFVGVPANFFSVAGATATNPANSGVVTAVFPATASALTVVNIAAIPGVPVPVKGATVVRTRIATEQYTGVLTWSPPVTGSGLGRPATFAGGQVYTAIITLTAKAGYTFIGVPANFFSVAGATATNPANSGVVTAVFPATAP
ncbi:MAG: hypothetical protein JW990_13110, partial [Thermoleophilia bacterium]|nr:hypothetical protein [Thermoleophilia bacterium]